MKIGDLVKWNRKTYVVAETYESKVWRTDKMGKKINWAQIEPEPFARILVSEGNVRGIPQVDLEVVSECS